MTKTILLLDDDPDEHLILLDGFAALGMSVNLQQFHTLPSLLDYLDKVAVLPEILLLDVNLPGETGVEAIRILKSQERFANLPIVMYSNASDERTINESFDRGASAYMKKTNTLEMLTRNLSTLMAWNIQTIFNLPVTDRTFLN